MSSSGLSVRTSTIDSLEQLRETVHGADLDVVQLQPGQLEGVLTHVTSPSLACSVGRFSRGIRSRGVFSRENITLWLLVDRAAKVTEWSHEMEAGNLVSIPPGADHEGLYLGPTRYVALSLRPSDLADAFGADSALSDPGCWAVRQLWRSAPVVGRRELDYLTSIVSGLAGQADLSVQAGDFWQRSIVELFAFVVASALPAERLDTVQSAARLVRDVERFVDEHTPGPLHVSDICRALNVSRRSLYRAFEEVTGIGAMTFLRRKRLSRVHVELRRAAGEGQSVTKLALENGFAELGRFSRQYWALFGEFPSETLRRRH